MADKVIIEVEDLFDSSDDNTVNLASNISIYKICQTINDLYQINTNVFDESSNIVVYVREVTDIQDDVNYLGAFYKFNYVTKSWDQIVITNHSHVNKYILDNISAVHNTNIDENKNYSLRLIKNNNNYEVEWHDDQTLPDLPSNPEQQMYLSSDGKTISWTNNIAPAQTFKKIEPFILNENNFVDHNTINISLNGVSLDVVNDDLLLYDSGKLLDIVTKSYNYDGTLRIVINTNDFDIGDKISIIIIKNGISGFLSAVNDEYITKKELLESDKNININIDLNKYATIKALDNYSKSTHIHKEYASSVHNHDYRYANAKHTHNEYLTRPQVLAILADAADEDGNVETSKILESIVNGLQLEVDLVKNKNYIDQNTLEQQLIELKSILSNTNNIYYNDKTLTEILSSLSQIDLSDKSISADNIKLNFSKVDSNIGGFSDGDTVYEGMSLSEFITQLVQEKQVYEKPVLDAKITKTNNTSNYEIGEMCDIVIKTNFIQNDAGTIKSIKCKIKTAEYNVPQIYDIPLDTCSYELTNMQMIPLHDNIVAEISIIAEFNASRYVNEGIITKDIELTANRFAFCGGNTHLLTHDVINQSHFVRDTSIMHEFEKTKEIVFKTSPDITTKCIVVAIPSSWNYHIDDIVYLEQNTSILDLCNAYDTIIDGDNNTIGEKYNMFVYKLLVPVKTSMHFKITLSE